MLLKCSESYQEKLSDNFFYDYYVCDEKCFACTQTFHDRSLSAFEDVANKLSSNSADILVPFKASQLTHYLG